MPEDETTKAEGNVDPKSDESMVPNFQNTALCVFKPDNPIRAWCIKIVHTNEFDMISIFVILMNCLLMLISAWTPPPHNLEFPWAEHLFNILFTIELILKVVAKGFYSGPYAYLKDGWNWLDFVIVVVGWAAYFPSVPGVSALRTFRVLRPLKTLSSMPGMRVIITALMTSIPALINVMSMMVFTFAIFGIVGVQLYNGVLEGGCFIADHKFDELPSINYLHHTSLAELPAERILGKSNTDNKFFHDWTSGMNDASPPENMDPYDDGTCMLWDANDWPLNARSSMIVDKSNGGRHCPPISVGKRTIERYCGRIHHGEKKIANSFSANATERNAIGTLHSFGTGNFDNIFKAVLSIYTSITLEGWVDIMYMLYDAFGMKGITAFYFVLMILFGSFFMLNLTLAVVEGAMGDAEEDMEAEEEEHKKEVEALHTDEPKDEEVPEKRKKGGIPWIRKIVQHPDPDKMTMFENFVTLAVIANTLVMALEMYEPGTRAQNTWDFSSGTDSSKWTVESVPEPYEDEMSTALDLCNDIFTWLFVGELIMKLFGLGVRDYVADRMNQLDFVVTVIPVVEFILQRAVENSSSSGIGALRSFRLFRLIKLARSWKNLYDLLIALAASITGCSNACLLLIIIMFIFTLLGKQMFGGQMATCLPITWREQYKEFYDDKYWGDCAVPDDDIARGHFDYFWWSFMTVFQVLTGENWNEVLYFAIDGTSWELASIYFVMLNVVGQYVVFNIFLAILLGNMEDTGSEEVEGAEGDDGAKYQVEGAGTAKVLPEGEEQESSDKDGPELALGGTALGFLPTTNKFRVFCFGIISSKRFDNFILFLIGISSVMLAIDQPFLENCETVRDDSGEIIMKFPDLMAPNDIECQQKDVMAVLDLIITFLFIIECVLKVCALGFVMHKNSYLQNNWNKLDFFIVMVSIVNLSLGDDPNVKSLKALRALRALRPLRLLSRYPGMQLVVGSILEGMPEIINVSVVCLLFYLIFAIVGVQNWKGALNQCNNGDKICHPNVEIDIDHPSLQCCTFPDGSTSWADRDCSKCSKDVQFPEGRKCGPQIGCGFGDGYLLEEHGLSGLSTKAWDDVEQVGDVVTGGFFHVTGESCGMLSKRKPLAACEELAYCRLFDPVVVDDDEMNLAGGIMNTKGTDDKNMNPLTKAEQEKIRPKVCNEYCADDKVAATCSPLFERGMISDSGTISAANMTKVLVKRFWKKEFQIKEVWEAQPVNFNNVGQALLAVFECSSGEMWPNIMYAVMDSVGPDQPFSFEYGYIATPIYFFMIQVMCAFLLLNLFIGVLVEQYNSMKDGDGGGPMITESQKMWIETQRLALDCAPERKVVPPQNPYQRQLFSLVESRAFELLIMGCILLNIVFMMMRGYNQSDAMLDMLDVANMIFASIFTVEAVVKLVALEPVEYFSRSWNQFDFCIVLASWIGMVFDLGQFATLLRVARIARIFRLVQTSESLSTLFNTLLMSIPAIGNVASVTGLIFFVFAVLGMNLFSKVKLGDNLTPHANFRSFWGSMMLLFRMGTGESYNGVMHDCKIEEPFCDDSIVLNKNLSVSDCGSPGLAEIYFLLFFTLSAMLMFNIIVAIILDNYGDQEEQDQHFQKVGPEDMQVFKQVWAEKDPLARGSVDSEDLQWIIMHLPFPLGLARRGADGNQDDTDNLGMAKLARNKMKTLDCVPECNGKVYFHHVLRELVKNVHSDVDVSNLKDNPRMSELDNKAHHNKFEKRAKKQAKSSDNNKQNGEPWSVAESTASLRLQTAWRGKMCRKTLPKKGGQGQNITIIDADKNAGDKDSK